VKKHTAKEFDKIPTSKIQRASKFIATGARIGTNYLKHYSKRLVNPDITREELHSDNARDIYASLSELKGSALKVAQMLSMDKNLLPTAYQQKFAMAQYSAPPLSYPLVVKTFQKYFDKGPSEIFDTFTHHAKNAASMGQVHLATIKRPANRDGGHPAKAGDLKLAVKIQYPGVADSVKSDLAMVKPIALTMFNLNPVEYEEFIGEIELRMTEETDYKLELKRSRELSSKCKHIPNLVFPEYYPEYSSDKILTMDWIEGKPLGDIAMDQLPAGVGTKLGQAMWDFYHYQMHKLKSVHADPHPGNFIITPDYKLGIIDFGCVKVIPPKFHSIYFQLMDPSLLKDEKRMEKVFYDLHFIYPDDTAKDRKFFMELFHKLVELLARPFESDVFDFSKKEYFETLYGFGEELTNMKELRQSKRARGVRDAIYLNRTYFGLYNILHDLKAKIKVSSWRMNTEH
jgi:predicted unusual protein kinase regulating ubiquinone biosynthesis (AarF/ABC1/UbiB family)